MTYIQGFAMLGAIGAESPLSNNDAAFDYGVENMVKEQRLPNGTLKRYKLAQLRHWQWRYTYLMSRSTYVYDGGLGYYDLLQLYEADNEMNYIVPRMDQSQGQASYTVRFAVNSWKSRLVWRSADLMVEAWSLAFELIQAK